MLAMVAGPSQPTTMECPNCYRQVSPGAARCRSCGAVIPPAQHLLEQSGVIAPVATATKVVQEIGSLRVATLGDRFLALALDSLALVGAWTVVDTWAFLRWGVAGQSEFGLTAASVLLAAMLNVAIFFFYYCFLELMLGATLGKAMLGIRVLRDTDRSALSAAIIRNGMRIIDGIGFYAVGALVAGCTAFRQRLGDLCAGSIVIEEEIHAWAKVLALAVWMAALGGAGWAVPRVAARTYPGHAPRYLGQVVLEAGRSEHSVYVKAGRLRINVQMAPQAGQGSDSPSNNSEGQSK